MIRIIPPLWRRLTSVRVALTIAICAVFALALEPQARAQQAFKSSEEAVSTLVAAAKAGDTKALVAVFGPGGREIVSSGDPVADKNARERFVAAYEQKNAIVKEGEGKAVLFIGDIEWPFPIPLVEKSGAWHFDTAAGRNEILYRRIGRNELDVIQVCLAYVDAQIEYAGEDRGGRGVKAYAQRVVSSPGKKDGLYWPTKEGEPPSPLGELAAEASARGYKVGGGRAPYRGYYYKILTSQGAAAPGGAIDYIVRGNMIGGFALVAYPAEYANSGVMTFIVNHDGVIFQKDLGSATTSLAANMTSFNPDPTWRKVPAD